MKFQYCGVAEDNVTGAALGAVWGFLQSSPRPHADASRDRLGLTATSLQLSCATTKAYSEPA
jgi:predicted PhzF superfamily epimerase YddE/YHI9